MVRKLTMHGNLEFADPESIFSHLFGDDEFMKRYHKKINHDPYAEASCWNRSGEREVKYIATSEMPKLITKLAGSDSFSVREKQKYIRNGDIFTVSCEPVIDSPGGDRFVTHAETILSPDEKGGCAITSNVMLEFKGGLWGVEGAVESFMESKAKMTFDEWMATARVFLQEKMGVLKAGKDDNEEDFFDAADEIALAQISENPTDLGPVLGIFNRFRAVFSGNQESSLESNTFLLRTILREVHDIQISCAASKGQLEKLNTKMLQMQDDLDSVKSVLERQQVQTSSGNELAMFGLGIAAGLTLGFMYLRAQRQT